MERIVMKLFQYKGITNAKAPSERNNPSQQNRQLTERQCGWEFVSTYNLIQLKG